LARHCLASTKWSSESVTFNRISLTVVSTVGAGNSSLLQVWTIFVETMSSKRSGSLDSYNIR
jgi:hypothetical protein